MTFESINGVYINGKKIPAEEEHSLQDGDILQIGVPTEKDTPAEFVWKFHLSHVVPKKKKKQDAKENVNKVLVDRNRKRPRSEVDDAVPGPSGVKPSPSKPKLKR